MDIKIGEQIFFNRTLQPCIVCGKPFPYYKYNSMDDNGIITVEHITAHAGCRSLVKKIKEMKSKLLDLEFELFCKKMEK